MERHLTETGCGGREMKRKRESFPTLRVGHFSYTWHERVIALDQGGREGTLRVDTSSQRYSLN